MSLKNKRTLLLGKSGAGSVPGYWGAPPQGPCGGWDLTYRPDRDGPFPLTPPVPMPPGTIPIPNAKEPLNIPGIGPVGPDGLPLLRPWI